MAKPRSKTWARLMAAFMEDSSFRYPAEVLAISFSCCILVAITLVSAIEFATQYSTCVLVRASSSRPSFVASLCPCLPSSLTSNVPSLPAYLLLPLNLSPACFIPSTISSARAGKPPSGAVFFGRGGREGQGVNKAFPSRPSPVR